MEACSSSEMSVSFSLTAEIMFQKTEMIFVVIGVQI
jgi:hypothetical protein